jgi:hypothetical protein
VAPGGDALHPPDHRQVLAKHAGLHGQLGIRFDHVSYLYIPVKFAITKNADESLSI